MKKGILCLLVSASAFNMYGQNETAKLTFEMTDNKVEILKTIRILKQSNGHYFDLSSITNVYDQTLFKKV